MVCRLLWEDLGRDLLVEEVVETPDHKEEEEIGTHEGERGEFVAHEGERMEVVAHEGEEVEFVAHEGEMMESVANPC